MNVEDLRKLNKAELLEKKNANVLELKKVKFALKSGDINAENVNKSRALKSEIARISTVLNELELIKEDNG
jgi:ribosomal protein L29